MPFATASRAFDYPLWDLAGKQAGCAVYALIAARTGWPNMLPFSVPCYDTSLCFDDLHLDDDRDAAELIAEEACAGYARGHHAFKLKWGVVPATCPGTTASAEISLEDLVPPHHRSGGFFKLQRVMLFESLRSDFGKQAFTYKAHADRYHCPDGAE